MGTDNSAQCGEMSGYVDLPQRFCAAFFAISFFLSGDNLAARAKPPLAPPSFPIATAWGFLLSVGFSSAGILSVVARTTKAAISEMSLLLFLGRCMYILCHVLARLSMRKKMKLNLYRGFISCAETIFGRD